MRITKFRKSLEATRREIEDCTEEDGPTINKLLNKEHTLEEQIVYLTSIVEAITVVYDAKRKTRALLTGKAISESAVSEAQAQIDPKLSSLKKPIGGTLPIVQESEILTAVPVVPQIQAQSLPPENLAAQVPNRVLPQVSEQLEPQVPAPQASAQAVPHIRLHSSPPMSAILNNRPAHPHYPMPQLDEGEEYVPPSNSVAVASHGTLAKITISPITDPLDLARHFE